MKGSTALKTKKKIAILYTGGTIGMVKTDNGYAPKEGIFDSLLGDIDDLNREEMPSWEVIEFYPLLDSSNIMYEQWNDMARVIKENYEKYDGFVILHGTDTLAYTASALSFMLENLDKPVILTGSQIPLTALRSDGRENIIASLLIAKEGRVREVSLYFGGKLMRGNRSTKISADNLIAFDSPNCSPLARVGIGIDYIEGALQKKDWKTEAKHHGESTHSTGKEHSQKLEVTYIKPIPIGVIKAFPGIQFFLYEPVISQGINALVLETFGTGNLPSYDNQLIPVIKKAFENDVVVVVCSQCLQGTVRLGTYQTSSALAKAGAVCGYDMTTEAAVTKLYYLYSKGYKGEEVKRLMEANLRGELT